MLVNKLLECGYSVHQAINDADTLIVKVALELASSVNAVGVIANDTDVLVMLVAHHKAEMTVYMYTTAKQHVYCIGDIAANLGPVAVGRLLVIHALSGCDTTSALYGHGKVTAYRKLSAAAIPESFFLILANPSASPKDVLQAGSGLIAILYGGSVDDSLNNLRYRMYMNVSATSSRALQPERLVPTENATKFHIFRAHIQAVQWKELSTQVLTPDDWGWSLHKGEYIPIASDTDIAPADILKVVCCKCKNSAKKQCGTKLCQCVKYGLSCVTACKNCNGMSCENAKVQLLDDEDVLADEVAEVADDLEDYVFSDDTIDFAMPWTIEEEVTTSN
jgi:hypothetical protein